MEKSSLTAVKRFLGKNLIRVYREEPEQKQDEAEAAAASQKPAAAAPSSQNSTASADGRKRQFFAIRGGSQDGVYESLKEVLAAMAKGGSTFEVFNSKAEVAEFCRPPDLTPKEDEEVFIVWSGKSTGVMNAADCVAATVGVSGAKADGPMSRSKAQARWKEKQQPEAVAEAEPAAKGALEHLEYPSEDDWATVASGSQTRVFACWTAKGKGRIVFLWDEVARDVTKKICR